MRVERAPAGSTERPISHLAGFKGVLQVDGYDGYRVLLTRARQGMVIFVPLGESSDPTRSPDLYDETYGYLSGLGIEQA